MTRFLINRPIAVLMTFFVLLVFGLLSFRNVPVSLLPDIDVPQIIIKINYSNAAAAIIEENIAKPIRDKFSSIRNLKNIESVCSNHTGIIYLTFDYGTRMDLAYIEANEKLDQLTDLFPKEMPRPQLVRINTSDIPIARIQIIPKNSKDFLQVSELTEKVIKKRIEQLNGISIVDINGKQNSVIYIIPNKSKLSALGIDEALVTQLITQSNQEIGSLSVKDGQYRYFVKLANRLTNIKDIANIPLRLKNGSVIKLNEITSIVEQTEEPTGYHLLNGNEGLVITVHKQAESRMNELVPEISKAILKFSNDYPQIDFKITQDQTFLLNAGIDNLKQDLIYGGILCVILLFLLLGNYASPILMSISIPSSLLLTFIFFYIFDISLNIISLSGLALGIGMLIDNSIIVLDSITRKRREGLSMDESCVAGVREVVGPVISQVLTTIAIYAPLIYLNGLAGALVYDQAVALTIALCVSLVIAFFLIPVLYKIFLKRSPDLLKEDTKIYLWILSAYHSLVEKIFKRKKLFFYGTFALMPIGFILIYLIPFTSLPTIDSTESLVRIDWNDGIGAQENRRRIIEMNSMFSEEVVWESDLGIKQFLFQQENSSIQKAEVYYHFNTIEDRENGNRIIKDWFIKKYPHATFEIGPAPNAFTQLFTDSSPYFEARFMPIGEFNESFQDSFETFTKSIPFSTIVGKGSIQEQNIEMSIDESKLALYDVDLENFKIQMERLFGTAIISNISRFGELKSIRFKFEANTMEEYLRTTISNHKGVAYQLNEFVSYSYSMESKYITADRNGVYKSIILNAGTDIDKLKAMISEKRLNESMGIEFKGKYYESGNLLKEMIVVVMISLLLLYFILSVQFENLTQPILVMLTIPIGVLGAMPFLYFAEGKLDIMSSIGFIVVLGIIVDDPILKVETINRLLRQYMLMGLSKKEALKKAIHDSGDICLKPLLMTSLTTSLALVPILFTSGIGSDLQRPLVWVIVGGLTVGTFFTLWFIPLAYLFFTKTDV